MLGLSNGVRVLLKPTDFRADEILFSADLPKTRSGKIMRRLLRDIAENRSLGDTTTLADPNVVTNLTGEWQAAIARAAASEEE